MMTPILKSIASGPVKQPLLERTIGDCFDEIVERYSDRPGLIVRHQNVRWSYRQFHNEVNAFAAGLLKLGIHKGDRVGIWGPNSNEWAVTQFATAKIGAIMVCINPAYRLQELEYALTKAGCCALVTAASFKTSEYLRMLQTLAPELDECEPGKLTCGKLPKLKTIIRMGEDAAPGMYNFSSVGKLAERHEFEMLESLKRELFPDDAINIQFTSGTTGSPKGATLSHRNILNNGKIVCDTMLFTEKDKLCIPVPLYHCFGMVMGNLGCLTHGAAAVYPNDSFDPLKTLQAVAEEQCTALYGVPTMFIAELDHPRFEEFDLSSLRTGIMAGAPCPENIMRKVIENMHMRDILIAYGQTELSPVNCMTAVDDPVEKRVGTVGKPGPHLEVKLVDKDNKVVVIGNKGEICTRGYSVMKGYWDDEDRTAESIDAEGWLHSGDLGVMDKEGYISIVGRLKDMIIRGGENIYPREVEEFLYTHPAIQEVQVFGVPDDKFGEQVCAWIRLKEGKLPTEEEIREFCRERIAFFKIPCYIKFVDAFPMTVTGKIQKFKMRVLMLEELKIKTGVSR